MKLMNFCVFFLTFTAGTAAESMERNNQKKDFLVQQCQAFVEDETTVEFRFDLHEENIESRIDSLYLYNRNALSGEWLIIDTTLKEVAIEGTLKLPVHTLKYKKYLEGKRLLLLGDGKRYTLLENTSMYLKQHLAEDVKIFHGGIDAWLNMPRKREINKLKVLSAAEFVSESKLGRWHYIYDATELKSLIKRYKTQKSTLRKLDRFLLISPDLIENVVIPFDLGNVVFELSGGMQALDLFTENQGRIISANRARDQKAICKSPHES